MNEYKKRHRILRDLKAGTIIGIDLGEGITEEVKETDSFVPELYQGYWRLESSVVDSNGSVTKYTYDGSQFDKWNITTGNCYRTKEEAEHAKEVILFKAEYFKFIREENEKVGWVCDWSDPDQDKYYSSWVHDANEPFAYRANYTQHRESKYYSTWEIQEKAIKKFGDKLKMLHE